jgi:RHS repeat-associated protein
LRSATAGALAILLVAAAAVAIDPGRSVAAAPPPVQAATGGLAEEAAAGLPSGGAMGPFAADTASRLRVAATETEPVACDPATLPAPDTVVAQPKQATRLLHDGADLEVGSDAVQTTTTLEAESLCEPSIPVLDQGMTNVTTGPRRAYRFLPNGKFKAKMKIRVPYDPSLIPGGLSDQDVYTFYYDTVETTWRALERVSVDPATSTVISLTDHFTDFINGTVTVPDHPETFSQNPNSLKDVKAADPGAGVNLIDAPSANNTGSARLAYPIELPPGRGGLAPPLGLSYDSGSGNGWLGIGWDIAMPSVTIDTRWGVPRYDAGLETETYMLNGEQLAPVAHRGPAQPRAAEKVFHARVEGEFRRIVRHGNSPANYWWEVTDKDGTRSFYGGDPAGGQADGYLLADAAGRVFRWALRETRDLNGNAVRYTYDAVSDVGMRDGTVPGKELYPRTINYTGSGSSPGAYTVTFTRDSELSNYVRRPDVVINGRAGFKMVTAELLARIEVRFGSQLVRRYDLGYTEGAFRKTLLKTITQRGGDGAVFNTHELSYYDDLRDAGGGYDGFANATTWSTGDDGVTAGLFDQGQASAISGATGTSIGGHLYVGFNPAAPTKQGSGGGKVGFTSSTTDGVLALVDLNGDNLPDKVFRSGDGIFFRLNTSGPDGSADFEAGRRQAPSLPAISADSSDTFSFGGEAYFVANIFANHATTFSTSSTYFFDVNADGLTDLVRDGRVLFNHLDASGVPTFTENSADTPVPIGDGSVDPNGLADDFDAARQQQIDNFPLADTVRRWQAPFSGRVRITGDVALIQDTGPDRAAYTTADGVRVAIEQDGAELWQTAIDADDYAPKTPANVDSIEVDRGDHLYFRVQSREDGAFDQVSWDPQIEYLDVTPVTDVNGLDAYKYRASGDFALAGRRGISVQMPFNGTVRVFGALRKLGVTTDDISLLVFKNGAQVHEQTLAWDATGEIPLDLPLTVARQDSIQLRVKADSPIDVRQIEWMPSISYTASPDTSPILDSAGDPLIVFFPPYDVDLYSVDDLTAPQQSWTVPSDGTVTVAPQLTMNGGDGTVVFTVKRRGALLAKRAITVTNGSVPDVSFPLSVTDGDELFFDFSTYDPALAARITGSSVTVDGDTVPSARHASAIPGLLALPYRGWTYAGYNGNRDRATAPIVEADLEQNFTATSTYDPTTAKAYPFTPNPTDPSWRGPDDMTYVKATSVSSSRLGRDAITVPTPADFAGARAVERLGQSGQTAIGGGVSFLSGSVSTGSTNSDVDYLDINGDKFPDVVSNGRVQFSTITGGLESANQPVPGLGTPRDSDATAINVGVGGSPAAFFANARGKVDTDGSTAPRNEHTDSQMTRLGLSLSAGLGRGDSTPQHDLIDVNGDALPDRITRTGSRLSVALNLGYKFADPEPWGGREINDGASENGSIGASLGYNGGIYDFAGGVSLTKSKSQTAETLLDLNGDGLLDRVLPGGNGLQVGFNTGNGFADPVPWGGAQNGVCRDNTSLGLAGIDWDRARICSGTTGLGAGLYFTIGIGPLCLVGCYLILNPGADGSQDMSREEAGLRDVDGDGNLDHVASTDDASMRVALNRTGRTNLLKTVQRPLGAKIDLEYQRDGNTVDAPDSRWVLSRTSVADGHPGDGVDTQVKTYQYAEGRYDRLERQFNGYRVVTTNEINPANGSTYRGTVEEYRNDSFYTRGLSTRALVRDGSGRPFRETEHTYLLRDVATGTEPADPNSTGAVFPQMVRTDERFYEGNPAPGKTTFMTNHYDALGNVDGYTDAGEAGTQDDVSATIGYSGCTDTYVVGSPTSVRVTNTAGRELRRRDATVDCATGDLRRVREFLADGAAAVTDMDYYPNGNLQRLTGPANQSGQRYALSYEYDGTTSTHVTRVSDSYGLASTATHDLRYGTIASNTDANGNTTSYTYDDVGRTLSVTGPYEQGGSTPTIRFDYHPDADVPWARTRHLDSFRSPTDTIDTVMFIDGLKRTIQSKKDATIHTAPDTPPVDVMSVSGRTVFDFVGRAVQNFYPVTEPLGTAGDFNPAVDSVAPARTTFDILDRVTSVTLPDNTVTTMAYGFAPDRTGATQFETTLTDAKGHVRRSYTDIRKNTTAVREANPAGGQPTIWTSYAYDPLDQLVEVTDDHNNRTTATYDNFGRRTAVETPDTGRTETVYDLVGNKVAKITADLRAEGKRINYSYDFTRLIAATYPDFPDNDVTYTYGAPGAADNRAGRITLVTDGSGAEERFYGKLGELTKEIKSVDSDTGPEPEVYTTQYTYDTFGRLQSLIYPDNEVLTYRYDSGGLLRAASGVKGSHTYNYLNRLEYDKFDQRAFMETGNNVRTSYRYDPNNRRLDNLQAGHAGGPKFQNLNYTYDAVGNVLNIANDVPVPPPSQDGGPTGQAYSYDDLDRLTGASGFYQYEPDKTDRYRLSLSYDTIHNLVNKQQVHELVEPSGSVVPQQKTSYTQDYTYDGTPHAATHIGVQTFSYDANGNQTGWADDTSGQRRTITWDEENRIQNLFDNGHEKTYKYDDGGERVIKRGPQGETVYVNQWFTIRNREIGTKHVFAGGERIVSKLVKQDKPGSGPPGNQPLEKDQYFFHADQVGSSNYVTDANGDIYQHTEYFPTGETWVDESSNKQRTPYLFSGKELDEETGLYYYGARYYDPRTGIWQSADPLLGSYLDGAPNGGVNSPVNLAPYTYTYNNPVRLTDPDGRWVNIAIGAGVGALIATGVEGYRQYRAGEFSGTRLLGAAAGGAITGAVAGATMGASLAVQATAATGASVVAGAVTREINGEEQTAKAVLTDAAVGLVGFGVATGVTKVAGAVLRPSANNAAASVERAAAEFCSFTAETRVLMADGTSKPIGDIQAGDYVLATDPETGKREAREVTDVWRHDDQVVDLDVDGHILTTTEDHPFWSETDHRWERADKLTGKDRLRGADGRLVKVRGLRHGTTHTAVAYNLSVDGLHTYYVLAGGEPVLVHNSNGCAKALGNGLFQHPDGSIRDAAGKFAGSTGARVGASAEKAVWDRLESQGMKVIRTPVAVRGNGGQLRIYDGAIDLGGGKIIGIEVKSGGARASAAQRRFDAWLTTNKQTAPTTVGRYAGQYKVVGVRPFNEP